MNAINYTKLEAIEAQRPLKVSDIFLAAEKPDAPVDFEEFMEVGWGLINKAIKEGYIIRIDSHDEEMNEELTWFALTKKGLALITKHMK